MSDKKKICIFGAGPHGQVVADIVKLLAQFELIGFIDSKNDVGTLISGIPVIGRQDDLLNLSRLFEFNFGIICIGDNYKRDALVNIISNIKPDFSFANIIHPNAIISENIKIGVGNVIMPGVVVNNNASIGNHCIINTNSSLEHYCQLLDFASLSPGVTTGGFVEIGTHSAVALGVTLFDRIKIGSNVVIGSGSLVTKDIEDNVLVYGSPAKVIRRREAGEQFLK